MTLKKWEDTGHQKQKHQITLCGELNLEEVMGLSLDRLGNKCGQSKISLTNQQMSIKNFTGHLFNQSCT